MANGNVYRVIHNHSYLNQPMRNIYHYRQDGVSGDANDLAVEWISQVAPDIRALQASIVTHQSVEVINLDDDTDFYDALFAPGTVGTRTGSALPSYCQQSFKLIRASRSVRHGQKRIGGLVETDYSGNDATATFQTLLDAAASAMGSPVQGADVNTEYVPVIYGLPTPSGKPLRIVDITNAIATHTGSQRTRTVYDA